MSIIQEGSGNIPQQAFEQWNDPQGNKLIAINRDGTIFCQGAGFTIGGQTIAGGIPIVQASQQDLNVNIEQTLSFTLPVTTLYQISIYADARADIGSNTLDVSVAWTDPPNTTRNSTVVTLASNQLADNYADVILVVGGTAVTITSTFGVDPFHYDLSLRIVALP
jgi:hypothetical protein